MIADILEQVFSYINNLSSGNQMIAGAISLWLMSVITYILREVPRKIIRFITKHTTTQITVTSQNSSFHNLLRWFDEEGYSKKFRRIKLSNGRWGCGNETIKSVGYGEHIIWYGFTPLLITLNKEDTNSDHDKETITIARIGRSHKMFDKLIAEISYKNKKDDRIEIYTQDKAEWRFSNWQPKRDFDSVIIKPIVLEKLLRSIDDFIEREDWYIKNGIPYSLGIMLYGPPGTGKSSVIKAIASRLNRDIYTASASGVSYRPEILQNVQNNSVTVIEDIDSCDSAKKRKGDNYQTYINKRKNVDPLEDESTKGSNPEEENDYPMFASISELLNAIDGIVTNHGRILIMTTNYPEKIDSAIIRDGRVDVKLEIGYLDLETFEIFLRRFFPNADYGILKNKKLNPKLTGATLQKCILDKMKFEDIIKKNTFTNVLQKERLEEPITV